MGGSGAYLLTGQPDDLASILLTAGPLVALVALGLYLIIRGVRFPRLSHRPLLADKARRLLAAWGVSAAGDPPAGTTNAVVAALATLERPATIGTGIGALVVAGGAVLV